MIVDGTLENISKIDAIVAPLLGIKSSSVRRGRDKFLIFDFGKQFKNEKFKYPVGEWRLVVYLCAWRLQTANEIIAAWDDPDEFIDQKIKFLEGKALESIIVSGPALETDILFETGLLLRLFPVYTYDEDHWLLFPPDGMRLTIGPGNIWSYERSDSDED